MTLFAWAMGMPVARAVPRTTGREGALVSTWWGRGSLFFYDDRRSQRGCEGAGGVRLVDEVELTSKGVVVAGGKGVETLTGNQKKRRLLRT